MSDVITGPEFECDPAIENELGLSASPNTLFKDERLLTREEAIARYFTPKEVYCGPKIRERIIRLPGNGEIAYLSPTTSMIMPQIRGLYDSGHVERIGRHMRDSEAHQLQNCGAAFIDDEYLPYYLPYMNDYFGADIRKEDVPKHPKFGCYVFTIFGHNRQFGAAAANLERSGHPGIGLPVLYKVVRNPSFSLVIEMQAAENTGLAPDITDRARSIVKYKLYRQQEGNPATQAEIAARFGVDIDQIWRAERYMALPDDIKKLVVEGKLVYSGAIELDRLKGLYFEAEIVELAQRLASRKASGGQIIDEVRKREIASSLPVETRLLVDSGTISLPQANELARLVRAGFPEDEITSFASWMSLARPKIDEVRSAISERINDWLAYGFISLFETATGDADERQKLQKELRDGQLRGSFQRAIQNVNGQLDGIAALLDLGLAGDIVESNPLSSDMRNSLVQPIEHLARALGDTEIPKDMSGILDMLEGSKVRIEPQFVPAVDKLIQKVAGLLESETLTSAHDQAERRQIAVAKIRELVRPDAQERLF